MPVTPIHHESRRIPWQTLAAAFCILFGLLLVLIVHPVGDGGWFWYSILFRSGKHLYSDLHLALQPMLVLEISSLQRLLGTRWIPSLSVGTLNVLLNVIALLLVNRFSAWKGWQKALLLVCVFCTTIDFITIRFDDYHVLSSCFELYSFALLLTLFRTQLSRWRLPILLALGFFSGLCITNRLNDGAALLGAVLFVVLWFGPAGGILYALTIAITAAVTTVGVVMLTGDSLHDWATYSIARAAAIKGGTGNILLYPLQLPLATFKHLFGEGWRVPVALLLSLVIAALCTYLLPKMRRPSGEWNRDLLRSRLVWLLLLVVLASVRAIYHGSAATGIAALFTLGMIVLFFWVLYRLLLARTGRTPMGWTPLELLILLPIGQLVSIAMSSARWYPNTFPPVAAFILILPIALATHFTPRWRKRFFLILITVLTISAFFEKLRAPFHWWSYESTGPRAQRIWYRHPAYGPMLIQADEFRLIEPVCRQIAAEGADSRELLSLPFPYANYFCNIPPWHGYVQTFFDTSSKATIDGLADELRTSPPQWILYQRQLHTLRAHELAFQSGRPLPHRALDALIMQKLQNGLWKATYENLPDYDDSQWILIRTR